MGFSSCVSVTMSADASTKRCLATLDALLDDSVAPTGAAVASALGGEPKEKIPRKEGQDDFDIDMPAQNVPASLVPFSISPTQPLPVGVSTSSVLPVASHDVAHLVQVVAMQSQQLTQLMELVRHQSCATVAHAQHAAEMHHGTAQLAAHSLSVVACCQDNPPQAEDPPVQKVGAKLLDEEPPPPEVQSRLPEDVMTHFKSVARTFEKELAKYVAASDSFEKYKSSAAALQVENGGYPPGVRPFKAPLELSELDAAFGEAVAQDYVIGVAIPKGTSRRDVLKRFHRAGARLNHEVFAQCYLERGAELKPSISHASFLERCNAFVVPDGKFDWTGIDDPVLATLPNAKLARKTAEDLYRSIINRLKSKKTKQLEN